MKLQKVFISLIILVQTFLPALSIPDSESTHQNTNEYRFFPTSEEITGPQESLYPEWWGKPPKIPEGLVCEDAGKCVECHQASALMDHYHAIACVRCHGGDPETQDKQKAHINLFPDPGDLRVAEQTCGRCHQEETQRVIHSPM